MATQSSYTTVKVSRFGFSVLSVNFNRANTQDIKEVVCNLIAATTKTIYEGDIEFINSQWDKSFEIEDKCIQFSIEAGGDHDNDYHVSIKHFDITEQQRINAVRAEPDVSDMFL
jgi:hypothetical protein